MSFAFNPPNSLQIYCRFCKKTVSANLERSIAGSGKVVDIDSTFEYVCPHCRRPHCFAGKDLIQNIENDTVENESLPRQYKISEHFLVGEKIRHPSYKSVGTVVGKYPGIPPRLLVKFEKNIVSLVEGIK